MPHGLKVTWHAFSSPWGEAILRYRIDAMRGNSGPTCQSTIDTCTIRAIVSGFRYSVHVSAYDVNGWSRPTVVLFVPH